MGNASVTTITPREDRAVGKASLRGLYVPGRRLPRAAPVGPTTRAARFLPATAPFASAPGTDMIQV